MFVKMVFANMVALQSEDPMKDLVGEGGPPQRDGTDGGTILENTKWGKTT